MNPPDPNAILLGVVIFLALTMAAAVWAKREKRRR
jgi:hypothetical protein